MKLEIQRVIYFITVKKKKSFVVPLTSDIKILKGSAQFLGTDNNFYNITAPELPDGWEINITQGPEAKIASVTIYDASRRANINLDNKIFNDPEIPEGCKVFMIFHELWHLRFGPDENRCDRYAFYSSLAAGVSPYLCYIAIRHFMPEHYNDRVVDMGLNLLQNEHLQNDI